MLQLNGKPIDALAMVVHKSNVQKVGRIWTKKLSAFGLVGWYILNLVLIRSMSSEEVIPRQLFEVAIQATIGSKVQARETISAIRKDVTAGLYGGHYERKVRRHGNSQSRKAIDTIAPIAQAS